MLKSAPKQHDNLEVVRASTQSTRMNFPGDRFLGQMYAKRFQAPYNKSQSGGPGVYLYQDLSAEGTYMYLYTQIPLQERGTLSATTGSEASRQSSPVSSRLSLLKRAFILKSTPLSKAAHMQQTVSITVMKPLLLGPSQDYSEGSSSFSAPHGLGMHCSLTSPSVQFCFFFLLSTASEVQSTA